MEGQVALNVSVKNALNIIGAVVEAQVSRGVVNEELSALSQDLTAQLLTQSTTEEIEEYAVKQ